MYIDLNKLNRAGYVVDISTDLSGDIDGVKITARDPIRLDWVPMGKQFANLGLTEADQVEILRELEKEIEAKQIWRVIKG